MTDKKQTTVQDLGAGGGATHGMKIRQITLRNVLGVREFQLDVDGATIIEGANGAGKSSVMKGLQALIGGGSMATIRNLDAPDDEPAEGVLVLDSDEFGRVRLEKNEAGLKIKTQVGDSQAFEDVKAPQRWLSRLFDAPALNPVRFLTAKPKERVNLLLESLKFDHNAEFLWSRMGLDRRDFKVASRPQHPLKEIADIRTAVFERRTSVNRDRKGEAEAADKIRRDIPAEVPSVEDTAVLEKELSAMNWEYGKAAEAAESLAKERKAAAVDSLNQLEQFQRAEIAEFEAKLRAELNEKLSAKKDELRSAMKKAQAYAEAECEKTEVSRQNDLAAANEIRERIIYAERQLATKREQQKNAVRIQTLAEQADKHDETSRTLDVLSKRLTAALYTLDAYKAELCDEIPIDGLEIDGDGIRVDGIPWDSVNTGRQIRVAVELACLRLSGKALRVVFIDGAEALDPDTLRLLIDELEAAGAQPFIARVSDGDLKVESL